MIFLGILILIYLSWAIYIILPINSQLRVSRPSNFDACHLVMVIDSCRSIFNGFYKGPSDKKLYIDLAVLLDIKICNFLYMHFNGFQSCYPFTLIYWLGALFIALPKWSSIFRKINCSSSKIILTCTRLLGWLG